MEKLEFSSESSLVSGDSPSYHRYLLISTELPTIRCVDDIDRSLVRLLMHDARRTYNQLSKEVRLSANTVADRVRRLRTSGVISRFCAELNPAALGRDLTMVADIRLREDVDRRQFEQGLRSVRQVVAGARMTGEYDYQLRFACVDPADYETVVDQLKRDHGVRELRSRLVLHDLVIDVGNLLDLACDNSTERVATNAATRVSRSQNQ
jgi:Lrp/AsnC family transcriptional regulator, leucine-responsive regulatory protein